MIADKLSLCFSALALKSSKSMLPSSSDFTYVSSTVSPDAVRIHSKSQEKPPTTSSDGDESRRWREGAAAPSDADSDFVDEVGDDYFGGPRVGHREEFRRHDAADVRPRAESQRVCYSSPIILRSCGS